jgi:hypothetical protein
MEFVHLTQCQLVPFDAVDDVFALEGQFALVLKQMKRKRLIDRIGREIDPGKLGRKQQPSNVRMDFGLNELMLLLRLFVGAPNNRVEARHDQKVVGVAAVALHPALHVIVKLLCMLQRMKRREHQLGDLSAEVLAGFRCAGLREYGIALDRSCRVQRAPHGKVLTLVVEHVHLFGREINRGVSVANKGVVVIAVPKPLAYVDELQSPFVGFLALEMSLTVEVVGLGLVLRGHHVPAGAAAAHDVDRGEAARQVEWLVVARRCSGDQADMLRHRGNARQQRGRLEMRHILRRAAEHVDAALARGIAIGQEDQVEFGPLGDLPQFDVVTEILAGVELRFGVQPCRDVIAGRVEKAAELELSLASCRHVVPLPWLRNAQGATTPQFSRMSIARRKAS